MNDTLAADHVDGAGDAIQEDGADQERPLPIRGLALASSGVQDVDDVDEDPLENAVDEHYLLGASVGDRLEATPGDVRY